MPLYKLKCFKFRVDLSLPSTYASVLRVFHNAHHLAVVKEGLDTSNPHMQGYCSHPLTVDMIRKKIRALAEYQSGNRFYSLTKCEEFPIEYLAYLMKEGPLTYFNIPQDIQDKVSAYQFEKKKAFKKKKKLTVYQEAEEYFLEQKLDHAEAWNDIHRKHITGLMTQWFLNRDALPREFYICTVIKALYARHCESDFFKSQILEKCFPNG